MIDDKSEYYVYVYIDPRNFEEFYYGKGKGDRKEAHLFEESDSEKSKRINAINKAGLKPMSLRLFSKLMGMLVSVKSNKKLLLLLTFYSKINHLKVFL